MTGVQTCALPIWRARNSYEPKRVLDGTRLILQRHGVRLARDPARLANSNAIAGVAAVQLGDMYGARVHFRAAFDVYPTTKNALRVAIVSFSPLARFVWTTRRRSVA